MAGLSWVMAIWLGSIIFAAGTDASPCADCGLGGASRRLMGVNNPATGGAAKENGGARAPAVPATTVETSIDPSIQAALNNSRGTRELSVFGTAPFRLSNRAWPCMELSFDSFTQTSGTRVSGFAYMRNIWDAIDGTVEYTPQSYIAGQRTSANGFPVSTQCLTVQTVASGSNFAGQPFYRVIHSTCNGSTTQKWFWVPNGSSYLIKNFWNGQCLYGEPGLAVLGNLGKNVITVTCTAPNYTNKNWFKNAV